MSRCAGHVEISPPAACGCRGRPGRRDSRYVRTRSCTAFGSGTLAPCPPGDSAVQFALGSQEGLLLLACSWGKVISVLLAPCPSARDDTLALRPGIDGECRFSGRGGSIGMTGTLTVTDSLSVPGFPAGPRTGSNGEDQCTCSHGWKLPIHRSWPVLTARLRQCGRMRLPQASAPVFPDTRLTSGLARVLGACTAGWSDRLAEHCGGGGAVLGCGRGSGPGTGDRVWETGMGISEFLTGLADLAPRNCAPSGGGTERAVFFLMPQTEGMESQALRLAGSRSVS